MDRNIVLVAHDIRSCHNVGSLLRTAEGLGIKHVYLTGYTPYPLVPNDTRLPHMAQKLTKQIHKTALGSENMIPFSYAEHVKPVIGTLKGEGYEICALEQTSQSIELHTYQPKNRVAIVLGREVEGIDSSILQLCDKHLEIPMLGQKESFNVVQAAAMALFHCRFA